MQLLKTNLKLNSYERLGMFLVLVLLILYFWESATVKVSVRKAENDFTPHPLSQKEINWGDTSKKQVIFTFDGGDRADSASQILDALQKHNVKGSFFLTGKFIERNPDLVRKIIAAGHEIFNHTFDHPHLLSLSDEEISRELKGADDILKHVAGTSTKPFFRPPYGERDQRILDIAFRNGYQSVYWSIDAHDWEERQGVTDGQVRDIILTNLKPGTIYLLHIGDSITGSILDDVLNEVESKGYKAVSLSQGI